jgi:hypothetical protein
VARFLVCAIAVGGIVFGVGDVDVAHASCAGPRLTVSRGVVAPGASLGVSGFGFGTDCNDTGQSGPPLGEPMEHITVVFVEGAERLTLGSVDADGDYEVEFSLTVPATATPGPATLAVGSATIPVWIDGPPVPADSPTSAPVVQGPSRESLTVSRAWQFVIVAAAAAAVAGAVVAVRRLRERRVERRNRRAATSRA